MASKTKIYFAIEYVKGGELFNKVSKGKLKEDVVRMYFQQLIEAVEFCHSRGVYHRDLKPENLLLDENGDLKILDFGLSTLKESRKQDGLLHTTCGTPVYVAPEVINKKGYDGAKADIWSCGVIMFVLLAGYLPFSDSNLMKMYRKIIRGDFRCPNWFNPEAKKLLSRIRDPNPSTIINIERIMSNIWFNKGYKQIVIPQSLRGQVRKSMPKYVDAAFFNPSKSGTESKDYDDQNALPLPRSPLRPTCYNNFDIISLSKGFDLSGLFEGNNNQISEARFTTKNSANTIVSKFEEIAMSTKSFSFRRKDGVVKLQGSREGKKGQLATDAEIFKVMLSFYVLEMKKTTRDMLEYKEFCDHELKPSLKDIVWVWQGCEVQQQA